MARYHHCAGDVSGHAAIGIIVLPFAQGSWWYAYGTDQELDSEARARVEAILDEVKASGMAPKSVMWLSAALEPDTHPTDVRIYLIAAREELEASGNPSLIEAAQELQAVIELIRPTVKQPFSLEATSTLHPVPTLDWPQ
ncbi:MAG: hypothetical protein B6I35_12380 [Anaerolineaceae bacterium 4572_32.2]|nr:MAG: hypothetical protein B6I35_12380 [Anaerolineaceae bacterium 4572_32.2]HEY72603.1 hypothetical protein [Thermoflexia bacterium]